MASDYEVKEGSTNCDTYFTAHCAAISNAQERIKEIEVTIKSLPYEVSVLKEAIDKMNNSMDRLIERLEERYVSRELYEANLQRITDALEASEEDRKAMKEQGTWIVRGMLVAALYIARDLVAYVTR